MVHGPQQMGAVSHIHLPDLFPVSAPLGGSHRNCCRGPGWGTGIPATAPPHWAAYSEVPRAGLLFLLPGLQKVAPTSLDPAAHRPPSRARLSGLCWDFRVVLPVPPGLPCPLGCPVAVSTGAWPCPHHSSFEGGGCEVWARLGAAAGGGPLKGT